MARWLIFGVGCLVLVAVAALVQPKRAPNQPVVPSPTPQSALVFAGTEGSTSKSFFLNRGSYRATWSAWGTSPSEPPCTHSVEFVGSNGAVVELASHVQVPATGTTAQIELTDLDPGDYSLQITSACAWQIELAIQPSAAQ
jgi:hypothetical protein